VTLPRTADMVVIGGGVMGASTAYHLARRGVKNILLLEKEQFYGQGATGSCAGGVRYQFSTEINVRLSQLSLPMLESFEEEIGQPIDYRQCGYLILLSNEEDLAQYEMNVRLQNELGVDTIILDGEEIRQRLPMMNLEDIQAGTFNAKDGLVDPNSVVMGYIHAASRLGVNTLSGVEVTGIDLQGDEIASIITSHGNIHTPILINTAGPWAGRIGQMAGVEIPITPLRR